jgi:hypothetical protein
MMYGETVQDLINRVKHSINQETGLNLNITFKLNDGIDFVSNTAKFGELKSQGLLNHSEVHTGHDTFIAYPLNNDEGGDEQDNNDQGDSPDGEIGEADNNTDTDSIPESDQFLDDSDKEADIADIVQRKEDKQSIKELVSNFPLIKIEAWANKITDNTPTETAFANYNTTIGELMEDMGCNIRDNILYYNGKPWPHYRRVQEMAGTNKEVKVIIKGTGMLGGAPNKRPRNNDNEEDKPSNSAQKGVPREERLEDQERQLDKLIKELDEYTSEDELLNSIVTQIKADKETSKNTPTTCMSNVFKKLPYDMLDKLEDGKHTNIFLTAQQISKVIYKENYKHIKDYEEVYATAKKLMEMQVLFAMLLQFHEDMFLERASMKADIKKIKKDMNKAEGAAEANRMRD